jgi:hypothetical protein
MPIIPFLNKTFYIDKNGENCYCLVQGNEGRAKNLEGYLKIEDFHAFKQQMILLKDPVGLARFIFEELGFTNNFSRN